MKPITDRQGFFVEAQHNLVGMVEVLEQQPHLDLDNLDAAKTALFVIDMNNGFAKQGALYSDNVGALITGIASLAARCRGRGIPIIAYSDLHTERSPELCSYPHHCMEGTDEVHTVAEIAAVGIDRTIAKNSTNGFLASHGLEDTGLTPVVDTFILVGDCTDICIHQFAVTLKAYCNELNRSARVIVPMNLVDTFDMEGHSAALMNVVFMSSMIANGVEVVKGIL